MQDIKNMEQNIEKLEKFLEGFEKPALNAEKKLMLKARILEKIDKPLVDFVTETSGHTVLSATEKAKVKEDVFALIKERYRPRLSWKYLWSFQKRFVSALLVVLVFFGSFSFMNSETGVVRAESFTSVDSFKGDVSIERDGELLAVYDGMQIFERDRIYTGSDGFVEIHFFDDSVSRLSSESEMIVNKLFRPVDSQIQSYVEVSLIDGIMWSRVVSLVEKNSSFVVEAVDLSIASKRGAFNVEVDQGTVEMDVYNHVVDIRAADGEVDRVQSGEKLIVNNSNELQLSTISDEEKQIAWIQENLTNDFNYLNEVEQKLLLAKAESIGVDMNSDFSLESSLKDKTLLFLTFDDVEKQRKKLDMAEKNFIAAQVKLNNGDLNSEDRESVEAAFLAFNDEVNQFYRLIEEVEYTDVSYASELESYVENKILTQKKDLSMAKIDGPLYDAKRLVEKLEILIADEGIELAELKRDQALNKLADAEDALSRGEEEAAVKVLEDYQRDVEQVVDIISTVTEEEKEVVKKQLVDSVAKDLDLIKNVQVGVTSDVTRKVTEEIVAAGASLPVDNVTVVTPEIKVTPPTVNEIAVTTTPEVKSSFDVFREVESVPDGTAMPAVTDDTKILPPQFEF